MTGMRGVSLCLAGLACAGAWVVLPGCRTPLPGTYHRTTGLRYGLSTRDYLLHIPPNYDERRAWPLVLVLHGAFSRAHTMEKRSGYSTLADREGFVVAYPNGIGVFGFLRHWNAGHCCGLAEMDRVDDVGFLHGLLREVSTEFHIDPQRIYVVGHSNGAMLAYRFAAEYAEHIAGVGVVAGSIGSAKGARGAVGRIGPPHQPVPLIAVHGRQDRQVPLAGGLSLHSGGRRYVSVFDSVGFWARHCDCGPVPEVHDDPQGGQQLVSWQDGAGHTRVVLHILEHWEHAWPGTATRRRRSPDHPPPVLEACEVIWDFFCRQSES
jgi:polyhydroxybutyrate depolymerase